jgi:hypothetical protein
MMRVFTVRTRAYLEKERREVDCYSGLAPTNGTAGHTRLQVDEEVSSRGPDCRFPVALASSEAWNVRELCPGVLLVSSV